MTESKNSVNNILKIVTAIAVIVTICAILWAYKLNTKCDQMNDEIVHLESTINILDVQLEYCEKSLEPSSIEYIYPALTEEEKVYKRLEQARERLDQVEASLDLQSKGLEALEDILSKENTKPW